ncbi:MAG: helicase-related protein [Gammaproteobacteria bacterium]|nr:helicase-related protein [Gammaproteobacteria bacterium]
MKLEDLQPDAAVRGVRPDGAVSVVGVQWHGEDALTLIYRPASGNVAEEILYRHDESRLEIVSKGRPWSFDGDGSLYRLVAEAHRIRLAHLFDPVLAVHTSLVDPLPHQITAVYEAMLPQQPLRFLLADDPGAGKTIMAGLLIKELIARGDLKRCLVVCPGSLVEQWQDELYRRFDLGFEILTNDKLDSARTGNWFVENDLAIARLDKLARNEDVQAKLAARDCHYDLVICDEAHKMSATFFGGEVRYTKRYRLGQLLSGVTRHFLLMTATPHNGKEEDFQLFLALLDGDRFEGRFRDGVHQVETRDLMRRMVKESLLKFDGRPLFPERRAYSVPYKLTEQEGRLYQAVTSYVREEFNRAEALQNDKRAGTVGFALTVLQRRLASSPEAIYQSLTRRRDRLESRMQEVETMKRGDSVPRMGTAFAWDAEELADLDEAPESEVEAAESAVLDEATAASTIVELQAEIGSLKRLQALAARIVRSGDDTKWRELSNLLLEVFAREGAVGGARSPSGECTGEAPRRLNASPGQKLVVFTEHRDTLAYLARRVATLLGRGDAVVQIHGGMGREQRRHAQESFLHDPEVQVLLATDAAGEGINLQRAHLMVNYDLPWNPNRLEQRFGRIHRIGQTEVCHLWNLVAEDTREGDVFQRLLDKLEQARDSLGGQVFDVLGKLQFDGKPLRQLLIEAIRYGDRPEVRARLDQAVGDAVDRERLQALLDDGALAQDVMDTTRVAQVREDLERAEARRLQPHYIESFFGEAFRRLGGNARQRERRRYQVSNVPAAIRNRDREQGLGDRVLPRYERIAFEKSLLTPPGKPPAAFVCPGHPLLDAVIDLTLERHRDLMKRGTVLVDEGDDGIECRVLFTLQHTIRDGGSSAEGDGRIASQRMLYVEIDSNGRRRHLHYAPYLDYRGLAESEPTPGEILARPELGWISEELEKEAQGEAIAKVVPEHIAEVRDRRLAWVGKTRAAVKERLTKEIAHWYHRAEQLRLQENAGKAGARLNSGEARRRAEDLEDRLRRRMEQLDREAQLSALPPVVIGGAVIVPMGLLANVCGVAAPEKTADTQAAAARARAVVMKVERGLGFEPVDREFEHLGYDIESKVPGTGKLRFLEVKGRESGADTISVTRNEVLTALNKPDDYILAIVEFLDEEQHRVHYVRGAFEQEPDWAVVRSEYRMKDLIARGEAPA